MLDRPYILLLWMVEPLPAWAKAEDETIPIVMVHLR
jgi:hypothetical protein